MPSRLLSVNTFADYRTARLTAGIAPNSVNRKHAYLRSMFNELRRSGQWKRPNPLTDLRQFKVQEHELSYLTSEQTADLMRTLTQGSNRHATMIAKVCLATGCRWSEAETLGSRHVRNAQIQFAETKSGRVRTIPIGFELEAALHRHHDAK